MRVPTSTAEARQGGDSARVSRCTHPHPRRATYHGVGERICIMHAVIISCERHRRPVVESASGVTTPLPVCQANLIARTSPKRRQSRSPATIDCIISSSHFWPFAVAYGIFCSSARIAQRAWAVFVLATLVFASPIPRAPALMRPRASSAHFTLALPRHRPGHSQSTFVRFPAANTPARDTFLTFPLAVFF